MIHPAEMCHISQTRLRIVKVVDDAPDRYVVDERWQHIQGLAKERGLAIMEAVKGRTFLVSESIQMISNHAFHELVVNPPVQIQVAGGLSEVLGYVKIAAEYVETLDIGYLEAR